LAATLVVAAMTLSTDVLAQPAQPAPPAPAVAPAAGERAPGPAGPGAAPAAAPDAAAAGEAGAGLGAPLPGSEPAPSAPAGAAPAAPPPEATASADAARIADLEARLAALEAHTFEAPDEERQILSIYGFTDVGLRKTWLLDGCWDTTRCIQDGKQPSRYRNLIDESPTFVLGNVNVYFDATPVENFRMLTEVRFSQYPQGTESGLGLERQNNTILDITSTTGRNKVTWSGIVLERAQLEWNRYDKLRLIAGYFLTPYGIWNVDHGVPTLISLVLPDFFAQEYIPNHQLGLQALGRTSLGSADLGYHAYVSNGRTPGITDNNAAKAFGARGFLEWHEPVDIVAGASGYYSHYSDRTKEVVDLQQFIVDSDPSVEYDEWAVAGDLAVNAGPTRIRAEWILHRIDYVDGLRASPAPTLYAVDRWRQNFYVIAAHEIGKTHVEPYVYLEYARRAQLGDRASSITSLGANYLINPNTQIKVQSAFVRFYPYDEPDAPEVDQNNFVLLDSRFVMAF
jgi:hypothetical protein